VGVAGALAAACLLAVLAWFGRDGKVAPPSLPTSALVEQGSQRPPEDVSGIAAWLKARRDLDEAESTPFTWPLPESSPLGASTSIPPDLLD
jgi:hypothetical protein